MFHRARALAIATLLALTCGPVHAQRVGVTPESLFNFEDATMPGKEFRVLRTSYAPGGQNGRHYHTSHVVLYVLEGAGIWEEDGKPAVTIKPGGSLHVRPGTVHAHRNASNSEKLVFLEFVIVDKGQRSTVPTP